MALRLQDGSHWNGTKRKRKFSDRELQVLTDEVQGHRSKLADDNISVHPRGNRDAISQSARAVGVFFFFFYKRSASDRKRWRRGE